MKLMDVINADMDGANMDDAFGQSNKWNEE